MATVRNLIAAVLAFSLLGGAYKLSYEKWSKTMDLFLYEDDEDVGIIAYGDSASFVVRYLSENKRKVKMFISLGASSENNIFEVKMVS